MHRQSLYFAMLCVGAAAFICGLCLMLGNAFVSGIPIPNGWERIGGVMSVTGLTMLDFARRRLRTRSIVVLTRAGIATFLLLGLTFLGALTYAKLAVPPENQGYFFAMFLCGYVVAFIAIPTALSYLGYPMLRPREVAAASTQP